MVNFGPVVAEIVSLVWGTPANLSGCRVLAALLHGTLVVGISQTLRCWTEGATYILAGRPSHWAYAHILVISVLNTGSLFVDVWILLAIFQIANKPYQET